ncbi:glycosyltransferase family 2 protein [Aequorivita lipolytica]|uniref:Glycosyltransferase n=1 Tax=Aequorivita lipolytica TaxID=153267 RepID=A0A5C6YMZ9_9FLAO|nr:glycosyltransferase [Aequorivita lipolytica]TXD68799.1 glycosyltransferase [Aequorivita lipolytica]SRX52050.1 GalNAc(5)-diNAcBac-PP-undecaprenol beta-1,3-glucosyltransferase [Aequorivita lipolytica]
MKLSIVIPVFNGEKFVENAYRYVLRQEISDFELIFIDNNSIDNSLELLRKIKKQDKRVMLLKETTQGAAAARNKGLGYAKGDYIYFFDVDDELFPNALKALMEVLENDEMLDSVFGNIIKTHKHIEDIVLPHESLEIIINHNQYWGIRWLDYGTLPGTPSFLHRKRVFEKTGNFNTTLLLGEDAAFLVKLGMECNIAHIDKYVMLYHRHQDSTVSRQNKVQAHKVFTYWEPLVQEHIPYYITTQTPLEFRKKILFKTYGSVAKMIALTEGYKARCELKEKLLTQIRPLKIPFLHRPFISMITISGSINLYKIYLFYVVRSYLKYCLK